MPSDNPITPKRMAYAEQQAYFKLRAAAKMAACQEEDLSRRMQNMPGAKKYLRSGVGMLNKLVSDLDSTIPPEQREHFSRQENSLRMIVGIKAQMPRDSDAEFGRWLSFHELDVVATAIRECCRACAIDDPQQQKQCKYARLLEVLPTDKPDENAPGCGYFAIWGGF